MLVFQLDLKKLSNAGNVNTSETEVFNTKKYFNYYWLDDIMFLFKLEKIHMNLRGLHQKVLFPLGTTATVFQRTSFNRYFSLPLPSH